MAHKSTWRFGLVGTVAVSQAQTTAPLLPDQFELTFAPQSLASTSVARTVNFANPNNSTVSILTVSISGSNAADYAYTNTCGPIAPAAQCAIQVTFTPHILDSSNAILAITSTGAASPASVNLQGISTSSANSPLVVVPYGSVSQESVPETVELAYNLPSPDNYFEVNSVSIQGPAAADYQEYDLGLCLNGAPTPGCIFELTFSPSAPGVRSATLVFNTSVGSVSFPLNGIGGDLNAPPLLSLSATTLDFGSQTLNASGPNQPVQLTNVSQVFLQFANISITGANASGFALENGCFYLNPNSQCGIFVSFTPQATGQRAASLVINDNAQGGPHTVALAGVGLAAGANLQIGNIRPILVSTGYPGPTVSAVVPATDFGVANLGLSTTTTNTILNIGSTSINLAESITGANASDFVINPKNDPTDCASMSSLPVNGACTATIQFVPNVLGARTATWIVADRISGYSQNLQINGVAGAGTKLIEFLSQSNPAAQNTVALFPPTPIGTTSQGVLQLQNVGSEAVTLTGSYFAPNPSDFSITSFSCGGVPYATLVQPGATCSLNVTFKPTAEGYRTATLALFDDAQNGSQTINIIGAAEPATLPKAVSPEAFDFGLNPLGLSVYAANSFRYVNYGNGLVTISSLILSGPNAADFAVYDNVCSKQLQPAASCVISLAYTPTVVGPEQAYLTLINDSPLGNITVAVYGTGASGTNNGVIVSPSVVNFTGPAISSFGEFPYAMSQIQITNPGGFPLQIVTTSFTGPAANDFSVSNTTCSLNICTLSLDFAALTSDPAAATLNIATNMGTATATLFGNFPTDTSTLTLPSSIIISFGSGSIGTGYASIYRNTLYDYPPSTPPINVTPLSPAITGLNAGDFSLATSTCTFQGPQNCCFTILFMPSEIGLRTAFLNLNLGNGETASIPITGTIFQ